MTAPQVGPSIQITVNESKRSDHRICGPRSSRTASHYSPQLVASPTETPQTATAALPAEDSRWDAESHGWLATGYRMSPATRAQRRAEAVILAPIARTPHHTAAARDS